MEIGMFVSLLGWCSVINTGVLFIWFFMLLLAKDAITGIHSKLFGLSKDEIIKTHYNLMAFFKLCLFIFNLVPYIALKILGV